MVSDRRAWRLGAALITLAVGVRSAGDAARAADAAVVATKPKTSVAQSPYDWTGFTVGGHVGYAAGASDWSATQALAATPSSSGSLDLFQGFDAFKGTGSYFGGLQAGYNYLFPSRLVLGAEADVIFPNSI